MRIKFVFEKQTHTHKELLIHCVPRAMIAPISKVETLGKRADFESGDTGRDDYFRFSNTESEVSLTAGHDGFGTQRKVLCWKGRVSGIGPEAA